jgi:hypothetical protein
MSVGRPCRSPSSARFAKSFLEKQIKALPGDNAALLATFAKDAVVMLPRVAAKIEPDLELGGQIAGMNPACRDEGREALAARRRRHVLIAA